MSTTETTTRRGFAGASSESKPTLINLGYVAAVGDVKLTEPQEGKVQYFMQNIEIAARGAGYGNKSTFYYRPEFLKEGFNPTNLAEQYGPEIGASMLKTYRRNIYELNGEKTGNLSTLLGLCGGNQEAFEALAVRFFDIPADVENFSAAVKEILEQFLIEEGNGQDFMYTLVQQRVPTDQTDDSGKVIWVNGPYYNLGKFSANTSKNREKAIKQAATAGAAKVKVTFSDADLPY